MEKQTVKVYGILIAALAVAGLFARDGHLFGIMNADPALDWLRVGLAALLLYAGFKSDDATFIRGSLLFVGVLYVGMAILGLADSKLWGLLPNGLTGFDIVFHLVTGAAALSIAARRTRPATAKG
jgi:hypothetical protein